MAIHPTAIVDLRAQIASDAEVGPFCNIGPDVVLAAGVTLHSHVVVYGPTEIGEGTVAWPGVVLGGAPQDRKYQNEPTRLVIGRRNVFRECSTAHRGTTVGHSVTTIGDDNLFMAYSHVAHDCIIGSHCTFANYSAVAGHVHLFDGAILGGMVGLHQFARIGRMGMAGAGAMVSQDIPPFSIAHGDHARWMGLNRVGLRRAGFSAEAISTLRRAYHVLLQAGLPLPKALAQLESEGPLSPEVMEVVAFIRSSRRGICRMKAVGGASD